MYFFKIFSQLEDDSSDDNSSIISLDTDKVSPPRNKTPTHSCLSSNSVSTQPTPPPKVPQKPKRPWRTWKVIPGRIGKRQEKKKPAKEPLCFTSGLVCTNCQTPQVTLTNVRL